MPLPSACSVIDLAVRARDGRARAPAAGRCRSLRRSAAGSRAAARPRLNRGKQPALGDGLVAHDGVLGQHARQHRRHRVAVEPARDRHRRRARRHRSSGASAAMPSSSASHSSACGQVLRRVRPARSGGRPPAARQAGLAGVGQKTRPASLAPAEPDASRPSALADGHVDRIGHGAPRERASRRARCGGSTFLDTRRTPGGAARCGRRRSGARSRSAAPPSISTRDFARTDGGAPRRARPRRWSAPTACVARATIGAQGAPSGSSVQAASAGRIRVAMRPGVSRATATASAASAAATLAARRRTRCA